MGKALSETNDLSALRLLDRQRSHVLFVLSEPESDSNSEFLTWYQGPYRGAVLGCAGVLGGRHYEQHDVDITQGRFPRLPFGYLGIYELSLDGSQGARELIERIAALHREESSARVPATWLYYPVCEKVGRTPSKTPSMLTIAFANARPGEEALFREWYATRHIRHALNIPALVSGQCFQRTQFQESGAYEALFDTIAVYEQEGPPESIIRSFASLPAGTLEFPSLDVDPLRFSEWVYRPVRDGSQS